MKSKIKYVVWDLDLIKINWGCWNPAQHLLGERQEYTLHMSGSQAARTLTLMWPLEMMFSSNDLGLQLNVWVVSMTPPTNTLVVKFPRRATNEQWIQIIMFSNLWMTDACCILHGEGQKFIPMDGCLLAINSWFYLFIFFNLKESGVKSWWPSWQKGVKHRYRDILEQL